MEQNTNPQLPDPPSPLSVRERAALGLPSKADPNYLFRLKSIRMEVEKLLVEFTSNENDDPWERPWATCKRCLYKWQPMRVFPAPRQCARCHSSYWMSNPKLGSARKPSDLPNPHWEAPKKKRVNTSIPLMVGMRALTPPPTRNNGQDLYRFLTTSPLAPQPSSEAPSDPGVVQSGRTPLSSVPPAESPEVVEEIQGSNPSTRETEGDAHPASRNENDYTDYVVSGSDL